MNKELLFNNSFIFNFFMLMLSRLKRSSVPIHLKVKYHIDLRFFA
jgi:hypothetical protein